jgi:flagellar protein FlgJ
MIEGMTTAPLFQAEAAMGRGNADALASKAKAAGRFDEARAREVAEEFEATFIGVLVDIMFESVPTDGPFSGGHGERVFRSLLNQEYAGAIARQGGVGIADAVYREIIKMQAAGLTE